MKKVSVVVPCYNAARYLDKCLDYLLHQTIGIENMEIILVNDASTDDGATWNLIVEYEQKFPDTIIAISLEKNLRQGGARNVGVSYASGEYLIFCDADDWLLHETLEHCYQAAKEYNADVVEFLINDIRDHELTVPLEKGNRNLLIELDTEERRKEFLLLVSKEVSYGSQKKFYKLSLIQENHITFAEHLIFEEPSFMVPVRLYEHVHYFLDEKLYICYLSPGSTVRSDWKKEHKWDNPQVWMTLMEDLSKRGMLQKYYQELEYQFLKWGMGLTLRMILRQGGSVSKEELQFLVDMTLRLFPDIRKNQYLRKDAEREDSDSLLLVLLDMVVTDENVPVISGLLRKYV